MERETGIEPATNGLGKRPRRRAAAKKPNETWRNRKPQRVRNVPQDAAQGRENVPVHVAVMRRSIVRVFPHRHKGSVHTPEAPWALIGHTCFAWNRGLVLVELLADPVQRGVSLRPEESRALRGGLP